MSQIDDEAKKVRAKADRWVARNLVWITVVVLAFVAGAVLF